MDFLDPKKRRAHEIRLMIGYVLIGIVVLLATVVLWYLDEGFWLDKGKVIQNGLVIVSSHPGGGSIKLNGMPNGSTGARLTLPAGNYTMQISRAGYRTWQRVVAVEGDSVERFQYPFLFPTTLTTTPVQKLPANPAQATQSPNRRWLLLGSSETLGDFTLYDLSNPVQAATAVHIPSGVLTPPATKAPQGLSVVDWADDNQHVLLKHTYDKTYEYILLDTQHPTASLNLNKTLKTTPTQLSLQNEKYDHYFVYNGTTQELSTADLSNPTPVPLLEHVITYATSGNSVVLYTTAQNAPAGQTAAMLYQNGKSYLIRDVNEDATYLLDLTQYNGSWYIAAGASSENRVYVYQNPLDVLAGSPNVPLVPVAVLKINKPDYLSFSDSGQFVMAENDSSFAIYDAQYDENYVYTLNAPFDQPQAHAAWMDDGLLDYVSSGKLVVFDYDGTNLQTLMPANPAYAPFFDPNYKYVYTLAPSLGTTSVPASIVLTSTALRTPADL